MERIKSLKFNDYLYLDEGLKILNNDVIEIYLTVIYGYIALMFADEYDAIRFDFPKEGVFNELILQDLFKFIHDLAIKNDVNFKFNEYTHTVTNSITKNLVTEYNEIEIQVIEE